MGVVKKTILLIGMVDLIIVKNVPVQYLERLNNIYKLIYCHVLWTLPWSLLTVPPAAETVHSSGWTVLVILRPFPGPCKPMLSGIQIPFLFLSFVYKLSIKSSFKSKLSKVSESIAALKQTILHKISFSWLSGFFLISIERVLWPAALKSWLILVKIAFILE